MRRPEYLQPGDRVRIISTARKVSKGDMEYAAEILKSWGLDVMFGKNLFTECHQFAGNDQQRRVDLQEAVNDGDCKAIFCARGGYGTARILSDIDWSGMLEKPKWVIGFSDISVLLFQLYHQGIESVHGIMPGLFNKEGAATSIEMLKNLLFDGPQVIRAQPSSFSRAGEAAGRLVGGNLSIISISEGTPMNVTGRNNILFIEDLDEYLYHVDRMMVHLKLCGTLKSLSGLVVGQMSDMNDNIIPFGKQAYEIIHDHVAEYNYPVGYNFDIGHDLPNHPVIHGASCKLRVNSDGSSELSFD